MSELLKHDKVDVNRTDNDGGTALIWASLYYKLAIVRRLLAHDKVDANMRGIAWGTALLGAVRHQ